VSYLVDFLTKNFISVPNMLSLTPANVLLTVAQQLIEAVPLAFFHIAIAVAYYSLREVKEGIGVDQLTNVFD
jgi:hypothetical protein